MSSVPGPVIRFLIDSPALSSAIQPAMQQVRDQARATTQAIAADWQRMSAQIRASLLNEVSTTKQIGVARRELVSVLDRELAMLRSKDVLTTKELSTLKAMTLERERQADAIKRGAAIGITGGTASALGYGANQVSAQTMLGVERIVDSLVNRYLGGAAGALTRTVRDVSYYSNQARGGTGGGLFGLSGTALAGVGGAAALVGIGTALTGIAVAGGKLSIELTKLSEKTGLTTEEVIKLRSAATALDVDFDRVTIGFKKFSSELTLASTANLPGASKSAKEAGALFKALGVDVKLAAQDPFVAMQQLAKSLSALPDGFVKTTAATILFGRGGLELIPIFDKLVPAMTATAKSSEDLAKAMGKDGAADAAEKLRAQMVNFKNETDALEVALSQRLLPAMVSTVNWINSHMRLIGIVASGGASLVAEGLSSRFGHRTASSGIDFSVANDFISSSRDASKALLDVAKAEGKVGDGSKEAAEAARKLHERLEKIRLGFDSMLTSSPNRKDYFNIQQRHDEVMEQILGGKQPPLSTALGGGTDTGILSTILGPISSTGALNGALMPNAPPGAINAADLLKQINDAHEQKFQTQFDIDRESYQKELDQLNEALQKKLISQQEYNDASAKIAQDWAKTQEELNKKYIDEAGSLFDDLVSGNTKKFSKSFLKDVESIALKPFRDAFANYLGGIFSRLNGTINGTGSGKTAGGAGTSTLGPLGGIFGGVFGPNSPGGTPGWWPGSIGLGGHTTGPAGGGQFGVATQTMYVTAGVVNLSGPIGPGGSGNGVSVPGGSNFFGFGGNSFFGNNNPFSFGGIGGASGGGSAFGGIVGLLGKAAPFLAGALLLGSGIGSGNGASMSLGASSLASSGVAALAASGKISASLAGKLGGALGGAGMVGAGLAEGGVGGALSDIAGGAEIGSAIMPGIGTAIGAAAGAVAGVIRGIFGSKTWAQQVQHAMNVQQFNAPPSETFDFASNGSISSTLSTGFAQSGNTFSQFGLPSNTPFWANPIIGYLNPRQIRQLQSEQAGLDPNQPFLGFPSTNPFVGQGPLGYKAGTSPNVSVNLNLPGLMDATMAAAVFTEHAQTIAQLVGNQVRQSSSGFGRNVRSAVSLP